MMYNTEKIVGTDGPLISSSNFPWEKKRSHLEASVLYNYRKLQEKNLGSKCH